MTKRSHLIRVVGIVLPMIAAVASATGPESDNLVGRNVPPYPAGLDELQGSCIPGGPLPARICDYSLTVVGRFATDPALGATPTQLLAMRNLDPGARQARWNVTDAVVVPKPRKGYELQIGGCRIDRVGSANVVAFVRHGVREYSRDVRWARQFDIASGTLVPVAAKRVDCINEGLGI
jgi:hypothetical protein